MTQAKVSVEVHPNGRAPFRLSGTLSETRSDAGLFDWEGYFVCEREQCAEIFEAEEGFIRFPESADCQYVVVGVLNLNRVVIAGNGSELPKGWQFSN